ncbi:hypothetical protein HMPREF1292_00675 [Corynebacterium sp. KPL1995]|nr:hypothetical protein HMPREF1292_00675 [Corynebacterium sp. KPL1995]
MSKNGEFTLHHCREISRSNTSKAYPDFIQLARVRGDLVAAYHQTDLFTGFRFMKTFKQIAQAI